MYVYIFEDGTVQQHSKAPTRIDNECISDGTLIVLKCEDVKYVCEDGKLIELTTCHCGTVSDDKCHSMQ
ncbi:hypothetical protein ACI3PL_21455, partial [Lacticaseibacillus paracasei]